MKKNIPEVDFLIIYEIKPRDLENNILIKKELERRGYTVSMQNIFAMKEVKAKVIAGSIDDGEFMKLHTAASNTTHKFINLKPEQVFNNSADREEDFSLVVRGPARQALNIAWGDCSVRRYTEVFGLDPKNVYKTGHITMDLLREEFRPYFKSKEELCREYSLDPNKKLFLYISSFVWQTLTKEEILRNRRVHSGGDPFEKAKLSADSKNATLEWFDKVLPAHPDCEFVYRPHPAEANNDDLPEFAKKHPNFHVIGDHSVRQWIVASDKIYTWYSTSIGEVYAAKKNCSVLRPVKIPEYLEVEIYNNAHLIDTYEEFEKDFDRLCDFPGDFPVPKEDMEYYYFDPNTSYNFERYADAFEKVLNDDHFYIENPPRARRQSSFEKYKTKAKILRRNWLAVSPLVKLALKTPALKGGSFNRHVEQYRFNRNKIKKYVPSKKEVQTIERRIDEVLKFRKVRTDKQT